MTSKVSFNSDDLPFSVIPSCTSQKHTGKIKMLVAEKGGKVGCIIALPLTKCIQMYASALSGIGTTALFWGRQVLVGNVYSLPLTSFFSFSASLCPKDCIILLWVLGIKLLSAILCLDNLLSLGVSSLQRSRQDLRFLL